MFNNITASPNPVEQKKVLIEKEALNKKEKPNKGKGPVSYYRV